MAVGSRRAAEGQVDRIDAMADELAERLGEVYGEAVRSMTDEVEKTMRTFEANRARWEAAVKAGKKTQGEYDAWLKDQALHNEQIKAMRDTLAADLTAADRMAMGYASGTLPGVYAEGMNFSTYEVEHGARIDTSFTLYDKNTVLELVANEPDLLPKAEIDEEKDLSWNQRHVTSAVTQAVLKGASIDKLAKSLETVAGMDKRAAMRSARTAMTAAHSLGKIKGYRRASDMGVSLKKRWIATLDSRTRSSHRALDEETVSLEDKFSNGLSYPADPSGPAAEVYNCRCTMVPVMDGVEYGKVKRAENLGGMTYDEWRGAK